MITFSFPAYNPTHTLSIDAQLLGDTDIPSITIKPIYTMDGNVLTRRKTPRKAISSSWQFKGVFNIFRVRYFFQQAEGQYILYTHYDGSQWVIVVAAKAFPVESTNLRAYNWEDEDSNLVDPGLGSRESEETYMFSLAVDRWPYVQL